MKMKCSRKYPKIINELIEINEDNLSKQNDIQSQRAFSACFKNNINILSQTFISRESQYQDTAEDNLYYNSDNNLNNDKRKSSHILSSKPNKNIKVNKY